MASRLAFDEAAARRWSEGVAAMQAPRVIDRDGAPYLHRYEIAGYRAGYRGPSIPSLYLHHFLASDRRAEVHSHPWEWAVSLILTGGYRESRCDIDGRETIAVYRPGDINILTASDRHRIDLLDGDCWTLFLAGHYARPWSFYGAC